MRGQLAGRADRRAVAVIGVWDPISNVHRALFDRVTAAARERDLSSVVIVIDPHPAAYRPGEPAYPVHRDLASRTRTILDAGVDGVLALRFSGRDVYAGAQEVLAAVAAYVELAELWLGATQTLGRGDRGDDGAVREAAGSNGFRVQRLAEPERLGHEARSLLRAGRVAEVARLVGGPPVRRRPAVGDLRFGWCPGRYEAVPVLAPGARPGHGATFAVELEARVRGAQRMSWPDPSVEYLAFVAGPSEAANPTASAALSRMQGSRPPRENPC